MIDISRDSVLNDPKIKAIIEEGIQKEGSDCDGLFVDDLEWKVKDNKYVYVTYGVKTHQRIIRVLKGRIHFNKDLMLQGQEGYRITFSPTQRPCISIYRNTLLLEISHSMASEYCNIPAKQGKYYLKGFEDKFTLIIK